MTTSNYEKAFTQLKVKPAKLKRYIKHNKPKDRKCGIGKKRCKQCGRTGAHVSQYNIGLCRQCFRELAKSIGFKKFN